MDLDDALFFAYCEKRHRDNVIRFLRAVTQFKVIFVVDKNIRGGSVLSFMEFQSFS